MFFLKEPDMRPTDILPEDYDLQEFPLEKGDETMPLEQQKVNLISEFKKNNPGLYERYTDIIAANYDTPPYG
jgi:hypothetical protein